MKKIRELIHYFFREELDIRRRILNMTILATTIIVLPTEIISALNGSALLSIILGGVMFVWLVTGLLIVNKWPKSQAGGIYISVGANLVVFPVMFFTSGGIHSGMSMWFVLSMVFIWVLVQGPICYIIYGLSVLSFCACIILGNIHPELVTLLPNARSVDVDVIQSIVCVTFILGMIFTYENHVHGKQRKHLEERDIELKKAMEDLEQAMKDLQIANQAKSDFLANMSHEIRTPINAILGMDEMILRENQNPMIAEYASQIETAGHSLLALVNDILDFSKIESGKMELVPLEYDTYSLLNDSCNLIFMRANEKGLKLVLENDPNLPSMLFGDETRIRQILVNLLSNAVKYTKEGKITVRADFEELPKGNIMLILSVTDTGMGISKENLEKLFVSFQRIEEKKNRNIEGTGLGLTITKQFVTMMNGTVDVESEYGKGSTFTVRIPQKVVSGIPMGNFAGKFETAMSKKKAYKESFTAPEAKVLVVDDVKMNLDVFCMLLKKTQIRIDAALGGQQGLEMAMATRYDVIYMDHMMPEIDGIECFHRIRSNPDNPNCETPIIALTANAVVGAEEAYLKEGFAGYQSKPVQGHELEASLLSMLPAELVHLVRKDVPESAPAAEETTVTEQAPQREDSPAQEKIDTIPKEKKMDSWDLTEEDQAFLDKLDFVDVVTGMSYCGDMVDIFRDALSEYVSAAAEYDICDEYKASGDFKNYQIKVHALKSTSRMIGLTELGDKAFELEKAAKAEDAAYIEAHHEEVLDEYYEIVAKLKTILEM